MNAELLFVIETNEKSANARFIRDLFSLVAENESNLNSERTIAGNKEAILNGRWLNNLESIHSKKILQEKARYIPIIEPYIKEIFELANKASSYSARNYKDYEIKRF